jgi:orotate phosphoribosyltransferase
MNRKALGERLLNRAKELQALKFGDFTLTSGQKSSYYFDGRMLSLDPEGADLVSAAFLETVRHSGAEAAGGPAVAAVPIVGSLVLRARMEGYPLAGFFVRAEAKKHGAGKQVEGPVRGGMRVAVFDDTVSTGGSLLQAIDVVQEMGCRVVMTLCVLDRMQGGSDELRRRGLRFTPLWVADSAGNIRVQGD